MNLERGIIEMASPVMTDMQLAEKYGRRPVGGTAIDEPTELGYQCPKGHKWDALTWSEFKEHLWCYVCKLDYPSKDCPKQRVCWMSDEQWEMINKTLPFKPIIIEGIQHFPDCEVPHKENSKDEYDNICPRCGAEVKVRGKPHSVRCACTVCKWKGNYPLVVHKSAGWYMTQGFAGPRRGLPG